MDVTGGPSDRAARSPGPQHGRDRIGGIGDAGSRPSGGRFAGWGRPVGLLVAGAAAIWAVLTLVGQVITGTALGRGVVRTDTRIGGWFLEQRTPGLDQVTRYGSMLADTLTAIAVTLVVTACLLLARRGWTALTVIVAILGELFVFLLVTASVRRSRPPVPHLDPAPPTSSFPSGHTAAAVALYVGLAVLLLRGAVRRVLAVPVAVLLCLVPVVVGVSRLYRGMHYVSDVVFGALGGGCWLLVTLYVLTGPPTLGLRRPRRVGGAGHGRADGPAHGRRVHGRGPGAGTSPPSTVSGGRA